MSPLPYSTIAKRTIRSNWAKPILAYLHDRLGKKLFYLGLCSPLAHDIVEWLEHPDKVFAFQCRDYPSPSAWNQPRTAILELEELLLALERERKLSTFEVFDGYLEEVVLRGYDNSTPT